MAVIGAGRTGLATALTLAHLGHDVICTDVDSDRVAILKGGRSPFDEPGIAEPLRECLASGRLRFVPGAGGTAGLVGVAILCVPTPSRPDGSCDMAYLDTSIAELEGSLAVGSIVVVKSTVPVGTNVELATRLGPRGITVVSNPEFLREGTIMTDSLRPSRIVLGGCDQASLDRVASLFSGLGAPIVEMSYESAELTKYAANAYLAVRYSFVNELATLAAAVGADIDEVLAAMALDGRIGGSALRPGPGWGGPCLPKDSRSLLYQAGEAGEQLEVLGAAVEANRLRVDRVVEQARSACGGQLEGAVVAIWGLSFKAGTDDWRESPAMAAVEALAAAGSQCRAYDPAVPVGAEPVGVERAASAVAACVGAAVLLVLTDWEEFKVADLLEVANVLAGNVIVDSRGAIDRESAKEVHLNYVQIGQPVSSASMVAVGGPEL